MIAVIVGVVLLLAVVAIGVVWGGRMLSSGPGAADIGADGLAAMTVPPENYLVWSILSTLFCCLPLGVASIVFSSRVSQAWVMGDRAGAVEASRKAKRFAVLSALSTVVIYVVAGVVIGVVAVVQANASP